MDLNLVGGFLTVVAMGLAPVVVLLAARHTPRALAATRRALIRRHLWRRPPLAPTCAPLEDMAADLRRLYPDAHFPRAGLRMPKQRGILMAYDGRLVQAAAALEVPTTLLELPIDAFDREAERLRVEHALASAGLVWQVRPDLPREDPAA
jgi:hypothetical protein